MKIFSSNQFVLIWLLITSFAQALYAQEVEVCWTSPSIVKSYGTLSSDERYTCMKIQSSNSIWAAGLATQNGVQGIMLSNLDNAGRVTTVGHFFITGLSINNINTTTPTPMDLAFDNAGNIAIIAFRISSPEYQNQGVIFSVNPTASSINWTRTYRYSNWNAGSSSGAGKIFTPFAIKRLDGANLPNGSQFVVSGQYRTNSDERAGVLVLNTANGTLVNTNTQEYDFGGSSETFEDFTFVDRPISPAPSVDINAISIYAVGRLTVNGGTVNMHPFLHRLSISGASQSANFPRGVYNNTSTNMATPRRYNEGILREQTRLIICGFGSHTNNSLSQSTFYVYSTDFNGNLLWFRDYALASSNGVSINDRYDGLQAGGIVPVANGYLILGKSVITTTGGPGEYNSFILKIDLNGNPVSAFQYPIKINRHKSLDSDGGLNAYFVGGMKESSTATTSNAVLIKLDATGFSSMANVCSEPINFTVTNRSQPTTTYAFTAATPNPNLVNITPTILPPTFQPFCGCVGNPPIMPRMAMTSVNTISISPNPATDHLSLQLPSDREMSKLTVVNMNGQVVMEKGLDVTVKDFDLDISTLPSGMYLLKLEGTGKPEIQKFIKE